MTEGDTSEYADPEAVKRQRQRFRNVRVEFLELLAAQGKLALEMAGYKGSEVSVVDPKQRQRVIEEMLEDAERIDPTGTLLAHDAVRGLGHFLMDSSQVLQAESQRRDDAGTS